MHRRFPHPGLWLCGLGLLVCVGVGLARWKSSPSDDNSPPLPSTDHPSEVLLDEEERSYLWQCEHHGQFLNQRGFKAITKALRESDVSALRKILSDDFTGSVLSQPMEVSFVADYAEVVRSEDQGSPPQPLSGEEFIQRLLEFRAKFAKEPQASMSLITLTPPSRTQYGGVWDGAALLRLWGEATPGSPAEVMVSLKYRVSRPTEKMGSEAGWLKSCSITQTTVAKSPKPLLREAAAERGIDTSIFHDNWRVKGHDPNTGGVYLCDYDRDGYLDMLVTDLTGTVMYRGLPGGKFRRVNCGIDESPLPSNYFVALFADLDGDGWDDLILGNRIYRNEPNASGGRRFVSLGNKTNLRFPPKASQIVVADYDRDGKLDLYVTYPGTPNVGSWVTGKSGDERNNILLRNKGDWQFEDVTAAANAGGGNRSCFSAVWLDANNDGWPDLYVINEFGNGVLLLNRGNGTFEEKVLSTAPMDFGSMGVTAGDINNDGQIDLYIANMYSKAGTRVIGNLKKDAYPPDVMAIMRRFVTGSQLWLNHDGGKSFEPKGAPWQVAGIGWAYGPALIDLDNDGFLDIYATAGYISQDRTEPDG